MPKATIVQRYDSRTEQRGVHSTTSIAQLMGSAAHPSVIANVSLIQRPSLVPLQSRFALSVHYARNQWNLSPSKESLAWCKDSIWTASTRSLCQTRVITPVWTSSEQEVTQAASVRHSKHSNCGMSVAGSKAVARRRSEIAFTGEVAFRWFIARWSERFAGGQDGLDDGTVCNFCQDGTLTS